MSAAHTLKGMVSFFAAAPATEAALRLEQMGRAGLLDAPRRSWLSCKPPLTGCKAT